MNLPWRVDAADLQKQLNVPQAFVINDLESTAYGLRALSRADFITLHRGGGRPYGNLAVIAAGTGLGEAGVFWDGTFYHPFASEGGHGDFSPRNAVESELLEFLMARHGGHVSWERVLSGPGLVNIFRFLQAKGPTEPDPQVVEEMAAHDPAAVITRAGMASSCPVCSRTIDMFIDLYGAEAGNLALKMNALGGVYIAGGVVTHLLPRMTGGAFLRSFFDKGRVRPMLEAMPVYIVTATQAPLLGAAEFARARLPPAAFQAHA
jgi:glucokinase